MDQINVDEKRNSRWRKGFLILLCGLLLATVAWSAIKTFMDENVTEQLPQEPWILPDEIIRKVDSVSVLMDSLLNILYSPQ